jgi:hypothetical protein
MGLNALKIVSLGLTIAGAAISVIANQVGGKLQDQQIAEQVAKQVEEALKHD